MRNSKLSFSYHLGLDNIYLLTNQPGFSAVLAVQIKTPGHCFAQSYYRDFRVQDEANGYRLTVLDYQEYLSCVTGDSLLVSGGPESAVGMKFSARNKDNDMSVGHCAQDWKSGNLI